jgi:hypothetical protein
MKKLVMAFLFLASAVQAIDYRDSFPDGRYLGRGDWSNNYGEEGDYVSYVNIDANDVHTDYVWKVGHRSINVSFWFYGQGWFSVVYQGNIVGEGFCMERQCQYDMQIGDARYTETFGFDGDHFRKIGHRKSGDRITRWEDLLYKLDDTNSDVSDSLPPANPEEQSDVSAGPLQ